MCESAEMRLYLLRCTCSRTAGGKASWSCRTRWHPAASGTPQTCCSWTHPVYSSGCRRPDRKCRRSCPCWETPPPQRCPVETRYGKNNQLYSGIFATRWSRGGWSSFFKRLSNASRCFWGCIQKWCCLSLRLYRRTHPGLKVGCHWSSAAGNTPRWL